MKTTFNIQDLKQMFGGYIAPDFESKRVARIPNAGETIDRIIRYDSPKVEISEVALLDDGLEHKNALGAILYMPVSINGWQIPGEPSISISCKKTIVETALTGNTRRGTVKELISTDDYNIEIKGIIINTETNEYPESDVEKLKDTFELNASLPITCALTNIFDIHNIVIQSVNIPMMVGIQNAQAFTIKCVSDEDFQLVKR